jgi:hypothetical protein
MKYPACSFYLAPSEYYLFPNLKKHIKGREFSSIDEDMLAATDGLQRKQKNFSSIV